MAEKIVYRPKCASASRHILDRLLACLRFAVCSPLETVMRMMLNEEMPAYKRYHKPYNTHNGATCRKLKYRSIILHKRIDARKNEEYRDSAAQYQKQLD